ncbi:alpha-amylase family glycosyl hydrolase [Streptomyces odontomachi]|uniref:alpha-amylase family glycosyl hydrolase n=1 Tax=Streptomyces odontomachi TaxID=2944940 RepID=UPI00210B7DF0|nr:alpha-amylase family glycosyl hydrolase [Streptomyces sp. ODS25]
MTDTATPWWRDAVVYQVYLRSFADSDGDGTGDLRGVIDHLDHLTDLGVDALWLNPFYVSGEADAGYDVIDHRAVDPALGTLDDVDELLRQAHARGLRVVGDIVANHTSAHHPWFAAARRGGPGHPARARYHVAPGRDGGPPSDWQSLFGGPAWEPFGDGDWYLHLFDVEQPDLDWSHPDVVADVERTVRFWLDRGFDGLRFDAAGALAKAPGYPPIPAGERQPGDDHPFSDRPEVHRHHRRFAALIAERPGRFGVAETWGPAWVGEPYLRPDELQQAFAMDLVFTPLDAAALGEAVRDYLAAAARHGRRPAWPHGNHDVTRAATRWGPDGALAVLLLLLALPGATYLYAGDELALPEVEIADADLRDPTWRRSGGTERGRDGARVPLPWTHTAAGQHGFSPAGTSAPSWLPQPPGWGAHSVAAQRADPRSALSAVRSALAARAALRDAPNPVWLPAPEGVLAFRRGDVVCVLNTGAGPLALNTWGSDVLASSRTLDGGGRLAAPGTAWVRHGTGSVP